MRSIIPILLLAFSLLASCGGRDTSGPATRRTAETKAVPVFQTNARQEAGKKLYEAECSRCHPILLLSVGPSFERCREITPGGEEVLFSFVRNPQKILSEGNEYYNALWEQYNKAEMPAFPSLSDDEIRQIFEYVEARSEWQKKASASF